MWAPDVYEGLAHTGDGVHGDGVKGGPAFAVIVRASPCISCDRELSAWQCELLCGYAVVHEPSLYRGYVWASRHRRPVPTCGTAPRDLNAIPPIKSASPASNMTLACP